jgi:hypothetical protein
MRFVVSRITLIAVNGYAGELASLRAAIGKLAGSTPISATIDVIRSRHWKGRFLNDDSQGSASATIDDDAAGLRITFPRSLLDRARDRSVREVRKR